MAGVYDEVVVDPCHDACASFLDGLFRTDEDGVHDVLDICCGTGLLAAELAGRGYRVTGLDASEAMLARARGRRLGPEPRLIRATLPDLPVEGAFDAAVCTLDGFTYLAPADLRRTIAALARRLRPGGWLVFDVHTDAMMAFTAARPLVAGEKKGHRFAIRSAVDPAARVCDTSIQLVPADDDPFSEEHRQYFHRAEEVRAALTDAGLEPIAVRDGYSDRQADDSTLSATWIGRRR